MKIKNDTFISILSSHITTVPEQGGILGEKDGKIVAYYHDKDASICSSHAEYVPNITNLNSKIHEWAKYGIEFIGMIHSHPKDEYTLSDSDMLYIKKVFESYKVGDTLYFPVIIPGGIIIPYAVTKQEVGLSVVQEEIDIYI